MVLEDAAGLVNATIGNVINSIKKAVSAHTILALDLYEALAGLQTRWEVCLESWHTKPNNAGNGSTRPLQSLFVNHLNALRSILLRSFPELLVDIKTAAAAGANSNITSITQSTIRYLENIPLHETVIGNLLQSLGERNWLMGASEPPSPAKSSTEGGLLRLFVGTKQPLIPNCRR
jgi:exocyst complex protein 7